jgi:hypothetical protein
VACHDCGALPAVAVQSARRKSFVTSKGEQVKARLAGVGLLAVVGTLLTACSSSPRVTSSTPAVSPGAGLAATAPAGTAPAGANPDSGDCLLGANGADVEVGIANPTTSCSQWITNLAGIGLTWNFISQLVAPGQPGTADQETMQQVCDLTDGTQELYVEDAGGQSYGNSICSQEEQNSWTPESSPGPLATQAQQAAQSAAQASAAASSAAAQASASAAQAQNVAQGNSALSSDIGTLESDANSLNTNNQLASDVSQMKTDYGTEQRDYQTEQSDYRQGGCIGAGGDAGSVGADAGSVGADQGSLNADESSIQIDISGLQSDIKAVQNDVAQLSSDGAYPAQDPSGALAAGSKAISNANAAIQWATGQGNTVNGEAQQLATTAQNYMNQNGC